MREGPAHGRASHRSHLRPAMPRGAEGSIPQDGGLQPTPWPGGWRYTKHQRDIRLLTLGHHPPLAIPFLAPNPVFEINPRGVGLRASPCRRADSAPFEDGGRTHPVMSASLRACGVLSRRGGGAPPPPPGPTKTPPTKSPPPPRPPPPPRSGSRSSFFRRGRDPSALPPPMKSTATRFRWSRRST